MMQTLSSEQGFTLLEAITALAIFSLGIVVLYGLQTQSIGQNFSASRTTTASGWAGKKIEVLLSLPYTDLVDSNNDGVAGLRNNTVATADGSDSSPDGVYTMLWNVAPDWPIFGTKTIRVLVTSQRTGTQDLVDVAYIKHEGI